MAKGKRNRPEAPVEYLIGGRKFRPIGESTLEHDVFLMAGFRTAGLDRVPLEENEGAAEYAHRLLDVLVQSPAVLELAAALLIPDGMGDEDWAPATARETAVFFGRLTDPDDKAQVRALLVAVLIPFLESELSCLKRLVTSSSPPLETIATTREPAIGTATGAGSSGP